MKIQMMKGLLITLFVAAFSGNAAGKIPRQEAQAIPDGYKRIEIMAVAADVLKAVSDKYSLYSLSEAYLSDEDRNEYRLVLIYGKKKLVVHYKSTGEFIKEEVK